MRWKASVSWQSWVPCLWKGEYFEVYSQRIKKSFHKTEQHGILSSESNALDITNAMIIVLWKIKSIRNLMQTSISHIWNIISLYSLHQIRYINIGGTLKRDFKICWNMKLGFEEVKDGRLGIKLSNWKNVKKLKNFIRIVSYCTWRKSLIVAFLCFY